MKVIKEGHTYQLEYLDGIGATTLQFVQREPHHIPKQGVINQEVLRVLIDRVKFLDKELPWEGNREIIYHLRMALALHENRALLRHIEKDGLEVENIVTGDDGHFKYQNRVKSSIAERN